MKNKINIAATYVVCEQTKADALLSVAYKYKMTDCIIFSTVDCEVVGYPAKVTGLTLQDTKPVLIDDGKKVIRMKTYETLEDYTSKK